MKRVRDYPNLGNFSGLGLNEGFEIEDQRSNTSLSASRMAISCDRKRVTGKMDTRWIEPSGLQGTVSMESTVGNK